MKEDLQNHKIQLSPLSQEMLNVNVNVAKLLDCLFQKRGWGTFKSEKNDPPVQALVGSPMCKMQHILEILSRYFKVEIVTPQVHPKTQEEFGIKP